MKILMIDTNTLLKYKGGQEKVLCNMSNDFVNRGHDITVLCYEDLRNRGSFNLNDTKPKYYLDKRVKIVNEYTRSNFYIFKFLKEVTSLFVIFKKSRKKWRDLFWYFERAWAFRKYLYESKFDVIICYNIQETVISEKIFKSKTPVVCMFHGPLCFYKNEIKSFRWMGDSLKECALLQVLQQDDVKVLNDILDVKNVIYIPNVVPQNGVLYDYSVKKIVTVARVDRAKRLHLLVEAFEEIIKNKDMYGWTIDIWGDIDWDMDYYEEMQRFIIEHRMQDKIHFCGITDGIIEELRMASIFAFPTSFEGFSLAMTEAMSVGLPVVCVRDTPGVKELVTDKVNGVCTNPTVQSFADGLLELMSDADKRRMYGLKAKESVQKYSGEIVWGMWERELNSIVCKKSSENWG